MGNATLIVPWPFRLHELDKANQVNISIVKGGGK